MDQEVTVGRFLKGGLEAFYERRRQILDEADGVGQDAFETGRECDLPCLRIERSEERILLIRITFRHRIEQRGFPCIRIADQRNLHDLVAVPLFPVPLTMGLHDFELLLYLLYPLVDVPAVGFELRLPGSTRPDAGTEAGEVDALALQPRN